MWRALIVALLLASCGHSDARAVDASPKCTDAPCPEACYPTNAPDGGIMIVCPDAGH